MNIFKHLLQLLENAGLPEDPADAHDHGFAKGDMVLANGEPGIIKNFGGDAVYVKHADGSVEEYDITEIEHDHDAKARSSEMADAAIARSMKA